MSDLSNHQLACVVSALTALGCGTPDASPARRPPRADTPAAYDRQPPIGFATRVEEPSPMLLIGVGPTNLGIFRSGELLKAVHLAIPGDTCYRSHLDGSAGGERLAVSSPDFHWKFVDRNPCRHERSPIFSERVTREPLPSARLQMDRAFLGRCPLPPAPRAAPVQAITVHMDPHSSYVDVAQGRDLDGGAPFVNGDLITPRYDGRLQWRGVVVDDQGRPTDVWVEEPEPILVESKRETRELDWLRQTGGTCTRDCPADVYPLRHMTAELRRPRRHAAIRINWYDHVQLPFEIWSEGDGLAEGLYVAYADDGSPLVVGDHVLGARHGLWYYFGWRGSPRRQTIVAIDDYFLGEVRYSWRAPDDDRDPLDDLKEPWEQ